MTEYLAPSQLDVRLINTLSTLAPSIQVVFDDRRRDQRDEYSLTSGQFVPKRPGYYQIALSLFSVDDSMGVADFRLDGETLWVLNTDDGVGIIRKRFIANLDEDDVLTLHVERASTSPVLTLTPDDPRTRMEIDLI